VDKNSESAEVTAFMFAEPDFVISIFPEARLDLRLIRL